MKNKLLFFLIVGLMFGVLVCIQLLSFSPPVVLDVLSRNDSIDSMRAKLAVEGFLPKNGDMNVWEKKRLIGEWVVEIEPYQDLSLSGVLNLRSEYRHPWFRILNRSRNK